MSIEIPPGWTLCEWTLIWSRNKQLVHWHPRIASYSDAPLVLMRIRGLVKINSRGESAASNFSRIKLAAIEELLKRDTAAYEEEHGQDEPPVNPFFRTRPIRDHYDLVSHLRGWPPLTPFHVDEPVLVLPT